MAWMTYISHWFEQDDWYEGLQRVRNIHVIITIFYEGFFLIFHLIELCSIPYIYGHFVILNSETIIAI